MKRTVTAPSHVDTTDVAPRPEIQKSVADLRTPPENDAVYGRISESDPTIIALAADIQRNGILRSLVITEDDYVLDGNCRLCAARLAGFTTVPCQITNVRRGDPEFMQLLVSFNTQRVKTFDQVARELAVTVDPATAHRRLVESRKRDSAVTAEALELGVRRGRSAIKGNRPLADAVLKVVNSLDDYWPLTDRQIHYQLLNAPPRIHAKKRGIYGNTLRCYRVLCDVLTRLRLTGEIPFKSISDETRPCVTWNTHPNAGAYLQHELTRFLTHYWRDLQQSQPNHIEAVVEKMTLQSILEPVCGEFTIPLTIMRGHASLPPRWHIADRFNKSGKDKLVLVILSDLDPAGMTIAESLGRSMRDDFGIEEDRLVCIKAALNPEQVTAFSLTSDMLVKKKSPTAKEYIERFGPNVWELEALPPDKLQNILREALLSVVDVDMLNLEERAEHKDAADLEGYRTMALRIFEHGRKSGDGAESEPAAAAENES